LQNSDFDHETGLREFTLDDRRKVKDVVDRILDEMGDNHTLDLMFAPYANIVHKILTDEDIALQIREEANDWISQLEDWQDPES
jgi:uncharacterized membrane protein YheB (UPF0754 family)